ncbi:olfactory receptor 10T2-like [Numenius arquata]|uniref:olfactory receptor 10T2-like n=1 Tax=Numenius arquata TaxID=31919 RepID=UPI003D3049D6
MNETKVMEFILIGFSEFPDLQIPLFVFFFLTYLVTLTGNVLLMTIIRLHHHLHIPMYFFLSILSFSETCYTFALIPKMLVNLVTEEKAISFTGCAVQMFFFIGFGATNCMLLTAMGYDRCVAICKPLHYKVLMNDRVCSQLVAFATGTGFTLSLIVTYFVFTLPFCGGKEINHFFCDMAPVIQAACTENNGIETVIFIFCMVVVFGSFLLILLSYFLIFNTILKIPSTEGKGKAFSTCASHLTVVVVHFGCASIIYLRPKSTYCLQEDTLISVTYTVVTPLLNPVVYSLRNKDVHLALQEILNRINTWVSVVKDMHCCYSDPTSHSTTCTGTSHPNTSTSTSYTSFDNEYCHYSSCSDKYRHYSNSISTSTSHSCDQETMRSVHSPAPYTKDQLKSEHTGENSSDEDPGEGPSKADKGKDPSKVDPGESLRH